MKKFLGSFLLLAFMFTVLLGGQVSAGTNTGTTGSIDLSDLDLTDLKPGDVIEGDGFQLRQLSDEQLEKELGYSLPEEKMSVMAQQCATGSTAFTRGLTTDGPTSYRPVVNIYTELCLNDDNQYVIESIQSINIDATDGGVVKGVSGNTEASALNNGKTLFYVVDGYWYNNTTTTTGTTGGFTTPVASATFNASDTTNYFGYTYQSDNIILFN
ncbi:hypothetical protein AUO94_10985 [Planococcus kocurii]|uniref:Uncharacterized protein n=1 Tax=Planococcus kocurii TaxID=1374 RepID=A0ABM5WXS2_9BACL|nr:hypothetical protein [Planococcus kocurii]ALS79156.1 hypothetical protein AUO94_10985 [Planococcus kocurii]